jgi:hypothetical protein
MIDYKNHFEYTLNILKNNDNILLIRPNNCGSSTILKYFLMESCINNESYHGVYFTTTKRNLSWLYVIDLIIKNYPEYDKKINFFKLKNGSTINERSYISEYNIISKLYNIIIIDDIKYFFENNKHFRNFIFQYCSYNEQKYKKTKIILLDNNEYGLEIKNIFKDNNINLTINFLNEQDLKNMAKKTRKIKMDNIFY